MPLNLRPELISQAVTQAAVEHVPKACPHLASGEKSLPINQAPQVTSGQQAATVASNHMKPEIKIRAIPSRGHHQAGAGQHPAPVRMQDASIHLRRAPKIIAVNNQRLQILSATPLSI